MSINQLGVPSIVHNFFYIGRPNLFLPSQDRRGWGAFEGVHPIPLTYIGNIINLDDIEKWGGIKLLTIGD